MEEQVKKNKTKRRLIWRFLALLLVLLLVGELVLSSLTRVSFSVDQHDGELSSTAAQLLFEKDKYLRQTMLEREAALLSAQLSNDKYESYASKASVAIGQEKYAEAAEYLGYCLEYYQGDSKEELAGLHLKRAGLFILSNDPDCALSELDETLKLEPKNADALYLRIQLALEREDYEAAAADAWTYETAAEADTDTLKVFAGIYEFAGDTENAIRVYTLLLEDPETKEPDFYVSRARLFLLTDDVAGARKDLETFFLEGGEDENGEAALYLCGCYLQEGNYEAAKAAYDSALENGAEPNIEMKRWVAAACLSLEDYEGAELLISEVLEEDPDYEGAMYLKGLCRYAAADYEGATEAFTGSVELHQEEINSLYYRGLCEMLLGDLEAASADLSKVAEEGDSELQASAAELLSALQGEEHDHDHDHE